MLCSTFRLSGSSFKGACFTMHWSRTIANAWMLDLYPIESKQCSSCVCPPIRPWLVTCQVTIKELPVLSL